MPFIKPTDGVVRQVTLSGPAGTADITGYVQIVRLYESLCKPYLTAQLTLIDNDNVIDNLGIIGGEPCRIVFYSPPNNSNVYDTLLHVLSMSGHQSPTNIKTQIYELDLIGQAYFNDKANIVQKSFYQQGTAAIQEIWDRYLKAGDAPLVIPHQSEGMMGTDKNRSSIDHMKPFAAIDQIRKYLKFTPPSPTVLFRDRYKANLVPLLDLFGQGPSANYFIQKETWGVNFFDPDIYRTIIAAEADIDKNFNGEGTGGRGSMMNLAKAGVQGQAVFDMFKGVPVKFTQAAQMMGGNFGSGITSMGSALAGAINTVAGGLGGAPNVAGTDSDRWNRATAPDTKAMQDQMFAAEAKNGPQLKVKVPLQTGINVTVGTKINVSLIPPIGDFVRANIAKYSMSGDWLVKDLVHELYTDKREVKCTSVFQCIRGGYRW